MRIKVPSFRNIFKRSFSLKDPKQGFFNRLFAADIKGVHVNVRTAEGIASYWRCINIMTSTVALLPLKLFKQTGDSRERVLDAPSINALKNPNPNMISFTYNEMLMGSALNWGNGYAIIDIFRGAIELHPVHPSKVTPFLSDEEIFYDIDLGNGPQVFPKEMVIHLRGYGNDPLEGYNVLHRQRTTISLGLASQRENVNFYEKGTKIDGFLQVQGKLDDETKKGIRDSWGVIHGINGTGVGTAVLDQATDYIRLGMAPQDAQFIETQKFNNAEIATIFGVPLHMVNQLERATHSNIEHEQKEFVNYTLMPWLVKLEQEYNRKLLPTNQRKNHFFRFNVTGLLRGDSKARAEFSKTLINAGIINVNEARAWEELNPIDGGEIYRVPVNLIASTEFLQFSKKMASDGVVQTNNNTE